VAGKRQDKRLSAERIRPRALHVWKMMMLLISEIIEKPVFVVVK
jgi:hypothetical protein